MDKKTEDEIEAGRIRALAAILDETRLTEVEVEKGGLRIRVSRAAAAIAAHPASSAPSPAAASVSAPPSPAAAPEKHPGAVLSPMVGTAYLSPAPGSPAFVKVGDRVAQGQTLLIVEAMKTMNPIAAPRSGAVSAIFVEDAQPVEFGEPLMIVE